MIAGDQRAPTTQARELYVTVRPIAHARERRAILVAIILPAVGAALAIPYLWVHGSGWLDWWLFAIFYFASIIGITVGYHRHFTHRSFTVGLRWRLALAVLGYTAGQGPVTYWVSHHRLHHARADTADDPHSPLDTRGLLTVRSFWHAYVGWILGADRKANTAVLTPDLLKDRALMRLERWYLPIYLGSLLLPGAFGDGGDRPAPVRDRGDPSRRLPAPVRGAAGRFHRHLGMPFARTTLVQHP